MTALYTSGQVGVPKEGERPCPRCRGAGKTRADIRASALTHLSMIGCDRCAGTGVVPELRKGDREPMPPKPKLQVNPASGADSSAKGPRGIFTNGRGKT